MCLCSIFRNTANGSSDWIQLNLMQVFSCIKHELTILKQLQSRNPDVYSYNLLLIRFSGGLLENNDMRSKAKRCEKWYQTSWILYLGHHGKRHRNDVTTTKNNFTVTPWVLNLFVIALLILLIRLFSFWA